MLGLKKPSNNNGFKKISLDELAQIKMLDLRAMMKAKGVVLHRLNGQYEGQCPFHEDRERAPRLFVNQDPKGVWLWRCGGCDKAGTIIDFVMHSEDTGFIKAVESLKKQIHPMPKLNTKGSTIKEILSPILKNSVERRVDPATILAGKSVEEKQKLEECNDETGLVERSEDTATFKWSNLIYEAKEIKKALKIILKLIYKDSQFTDRIDLHRARSRKSFANQAAEKLDLQSAQIEEHLEAMLLILEEDKPKELKKEKMTKEEKEEALKLLKDPHLMDRMAKDLDKLGYVGEEINKKILFLVAVSRKLEKPVSAIIRSGSGAGKSVLMEQVLSLMPPEDVLFFSRITPQSLFYMGKEALDRKVLAIDEREGSQAADYSIRTLQTRGKLTLAASTKDPQTGHWKTLIKEFCARTPYMETSTKEKLNEENLNRCFELYLDESSEQTQRIQEAQRKEAAGIDAFGEDEKKSLRKLYQNAQKLLEPIEVKVPYDLAINLPQNWLRTRRDHERFLSLVKVITLLYQHQRKKSSVLEASKADCELAKTLAGHVMGNVFNDLAKPVAHFYELLKEKIQDKAQAVAIEDFEFTRREIRQWTGLPDYVVKRSMKSLEDLEYVEVKKASRGGRYQYHLI